MAIVLVVVESAICAMALYIEHMLWDGAGELERYAMGIGTIVASACLWVIFMLLIDLPLLHQDVLLALISPMGLGGLVVYLAHRHDATKKVKSALEDERKARLYQAGQASHTDGGYPPLDQEF